ncbi:MAG: hypothetical protein NT049_05635 [Planctomycetota bacterium]|nr:hypothetical protein [Planctomycetota bacterium]
MATRTSVTPRPWVIYEGKPTDILISGPGLDRARIPQGWFCRKPAAPPAS